MSTFPLDAVRRVCVIGAGPSGLAAARYLLAEKHFTAIDIFEQRPTVGGVWNITSKNAKTAPIPSTDPFWDGVSSVNRLGSNGEQEDKSKPQDGSQISRPDPRFDSPMYPSLETNIPHHIMAYSELTFLQTEGKSGPSETFSPSSVQHAGEKDHVHVPLFPPFPSVLTYLTQYSLPMLPNIQVSTKVTSVEPIPPTDLGATETSLNSTGTKWSVTTFHYPTSETKTEIYDAIIVANGHYTTPYVPDIPGIEAWSSAYPESVLHSRDYRGVEPYRGKKTVVIGGSASGLDIGQQISTVAQSPMIRVIRSGNPGTDPYAYKSIDEFLTPASASGEPNFRAIKFTDVNGKVHIETGIDQVLFATGYLYSFPFLSPEICNPLLGIPGTASDPPGHRVHGLYRDFFFSKNPTCVFLVLPLKVVPFPLAEAQSSVAARVWSGRLPLPDTTAMEADEHERLQRKGSGKAFHTLNWPDDVDYYNSFIDWATQASPRDGVEDLLPTPWDEEVRWLRKQFPDIRKRYIALGDARTKIERWEELGYSWKDGKGRIE